MQRCLCWKRPGKLSSNVLAPNYGICMCLHLMPSWASERELFFYHIGISNLDLWVYYDFIVCADQSEQWALFTYIFFLNNQSYWFCSSEWDLSSFSVIIFLVIPFAEVFKWCSGVHGSALAIRIFVCTTCGVYERWMECCCVFLRSIGMVIWVAVNIRVMIMVAEPQWWDLYPRFSKLFCEICRLILCGSLERWLD
jgi:hypothetical protein